MPTTTSKTPLGGIIRTAIKSARATVKPGVPKAPKPVRPAGPRRPRPTTPRPNVPGLPNADAIRSQARATADSVRASAQGMRGDIESLVKSGKIDPSKVSAIVKGRSDEIAKTVRSNTPQIRPRSR